MQGLSNKERYELGDCFGGFIEGSAIVLPVIGVTTIVFMQADLVKALVPLAVGGGIVWIVVSTLLGRVERVKWSGPDYNKEVKHDD